MTTKRFSLDSNVLVYAADRRAGARHERALAILDRAPRRDCILTLQALPEFFHATTRKGIVWKAATPRWRRRPLEREHRDGVNEAQCLACHKPLTETDYVFTLEPLKQAAAQ